MNGLERPRLERKVAEQVARVHGAELPQFIDPALHIGLIREGSPLVLVDRADARTTLAMLGVADMLEELDAQRPPMALALIVFVESFASFEFLPLHVVANDQACA